LVSKGSGARDPLDADDVAGHDEVADVGPNSLFAPVLDVIGEPARGGVHERLSMADEYGIEDHALSSGKSSQKNTSRVDGAAVAQRLLH
jgi:beta-glucosidase-like glycosyl hydrolase